MKPKHKKVDQLYAAEQFQNRYYDDMLGSFEISWQSNLTVAIREIMRAMILEWII